MTVLASCKKLKEIKLSGAFFEAIPFGKNCNHTILFRMLLWTVILSTFLKNPNFKYAVDVRKLL